MNSNVVEWLKQNKLLPRDTEHPDWGFRVAMSNVPVSDWTLRRNRLQPHDVWFGLGVSQLIGWRASLFLRDESVRVEWRPGAPAEVNAPLTLRRPGIWPACNDLDGVPQLVALAEKLLKVRFLRTARVEAASFTTAQLHLIVRWLAPACDEVHFVLGKLVGEIPSGAIVEDCNSADQGIRLCIAREAEN